MRIAIVGAGVSGLVTAYLLHREHEITVFEANDYVGGHTNTVDVEEEGRRFGVDTGFIVFNDRNYPYFTRLLERLGVATQPSEMSFSVRDDDLDLEYRGSSLNTLFAQRRNLVRPRFWQMIGDLARFYREGRAALRGTDLRADMTLGDFLRLRGYSQSFIEHHVVPMGAAIWSSSTRAMDRFPLSFFLRFFENHGLLDLRNRPQWRVIQGGSRRYVEALTHSFRRAIRLKTPVLSVRRDDDGVTITSAGSDPQRFDRVVLACHSDQSLRMLDDPTDAERQILGAIRYRPNDTVLHTDVSVMPRRQRAWASWNYHVDAGARDRAMVTYSMNRLQNLRSQQQYCVTLNRSEAVDPSRALRSFVYHHPVYTPEAVSAQGLHEQISGVRNTFYCGAYWGYGFHEDGVRSALRVCSHFGRSLS